jgi:hypothetical protein
VNITEPRAFQAQREWVATQAATRSLPIAWGVLTIFAVAQIIRLANGFNGASSNEGLYLTAGLRTWDGKVVDDRLLTQLPGSILWPALGAIGYEFLGLNGARLLALILTLIAFAALVLGTRQLFGDRAGTMTGLALAVSAPFLVLGHLALMESLAVAGMAICFYAITNLIARDDRLWLLIGSVALIAGILGQYRAGLFLIPMTLLLLVTRDRKGRLDVIVLFLTTSLGFIVYFEAFSQQVEIALQELSLLTPSAVAHDFATADGKRALLALWGLAPVAVAAVACIRERGRRRAAALALTVGPAFWVLALLTVADTSAMLVFPDLAVGLVAVYPVIGLALARLTLRGAEGLSLGLIVLFVGMIGWVHMSAFDHSWMDYRPMTAALTEEMEPGDGVLANDRWPFALALYGDGLIEDPMDLVDEEAILTNSELLDLCTFEWFVNGSGPASWPPFVDGVITRCGGFEERVSAESELTGIATRLRETTSTATTQLWFNTTPFGGVQ